jgi:hypothetical protein
MASDQDQVRGDVAAATPEGFARLIKKANKAAQRGYTLVGVVNVGGANLGAVYVRLPKGAPTRPHANIIDP